MSQPITATLPGSGASLPEPAAPSQAGVSAPWRLWLLRLTSFQAMLTVLLATVVFAMMRGGVADPDIWWHLRNADYLLTHGQFPDRDMYSFTVAGQAWMNHEWLAELPYLFGWRYAGLPGMQAIEFAVLVAIFWGLLYLCERETGNFKAAELACSVAAFLATVSFGLRTILFGYLSMVVLLVVLQRFRNGKSRALWSLPVLFCLWANTHGSWSLGLVLFGIFAASGLVSGTWGLVSAEAWSAQQLRQLIVAGVASVGALFVNPWGWKLVAYPFDLAFSQKLNVSHVAEWVPVNFHEARGKLVLVLLAILLLSAVVQQLRWRLADLALLLFGLYCGLTYTRFLFLLAILIAPVLTRMLDMIPPYRPEMETRVVNVIAVALMVAGIALYWPRAAELQSEVDAQYPAGAVAYLRAHPQTGPMLNFYLWGGYLGWTDPQVKSFVDSRVDIFEHSGVLADYIDLVRLNEPTRLLNKYGIESVLFPHGEFLTYALEHDPAWTTVYSDSLCVLLRRNSPSQPVAEAAR